jgi:hypothetical protein
MMKNERLKFIAEHTGDYITQGLFLEIGYSDNSLYTLKHYDHEYKGKQYPSIRRLYLELEDPTEYLFANTYFDGWKHWQRICSNAVCLKHIEEWREELEVKLRSQAILDIIATSAEQSQSSFQAAKWLADRGWDKRAPGRPTKADKLKDKAVTDRIENEFKGDIVRMKGFGGKK